ncbi:MAG TPA: SDR family oxidoreductase [Pyrinomonadaceae bacterium]|nr:SDR family oxidoreductase [Pyrinomonadaceae bacterium]
MVEKVLLAGATGRLGRHVRSELESLGHAVRALARDPCNLAGEDVEVFDCDARNADSLQGACEGVGSVISTLGASLALRYTAPGATYRDVDLGANLNLLAEAKRAGVRRFVYVSLYGAESLRGLGYVDAHEEFVEALAASGIDYAVVRPTGFFYVFEEVFKMARRGRAMLVGRGDARTNPIHEADVARACVEALEGGARELPVGGPDVYTRREVALLAFEALGKRPKVTSLPPGLMRSLIKPLAYFDRRLYDLLDFGVAVSTNDVVAPPYGARGLGEHFRRLASGGEAA